MRTLAPELIELCGAVRDETATSAQIARLEGLLADDPEARRFYRQFTQIGAMLERYEQMSLPVRAESEGAEPSKVVRVPRRLFSSASRWVALAACLVLAATIYSIVRRSPEPRPDAHANATASAETSIAFIQEAHACVLIPRLGPPIEFNGNFQLRPGDIVATAANGSAIVRFPGESTLFILSPDTRAWLSHEGTAKIVHLASGQLYCDVAPQTGGAQWRIITADGEAKVLGTRLAISAQDAGTRVAVTAGRVRVTARDSRQSVETPAGFAADLTPTTAKVTRLPPTEPTRVVSFTLVNADNNAPITGFERLTDLTVIDLGTLPTRRLNIRANCEPQLVGSVRFAITGTDAAGNPLPLVLPIAHSFPNQIEIYYPYMLAGDPSLEGENLPGYSYAWTPPAGRYTMTATPYAGIKESGAKGEPLTIRFEVVDNVAAR